MPADHGPLSAAYSSHGRAGAAAVLARVDVQRRGTAVARGVLRFANGTTQSAFDSLELPVTALQAGSGEVLASIVSEEVNGPVIVKRGERVEVGFPFFDWEARCLDESYVDLSQPLYSKLPFHYTAVPFPVRNALLGAAAMVRRRRAPVAAAVSFPEYPVCGVVDRVRNVIMSGADIGATKHVRGTLLLTHDMDDLSAQPGIEKLRAIEREHGFRSAWGILSEKYRAPASCVEALVAEGCEVFSHGYLHDGKLPYLPRAEQLRRLRHFFSAYPMLRGVTRGFRCGQLVRSRSLFAAVGQVFEYDLTPPSTEREGPYGARSGVSTVYPFWDEAGLLHLPLTLPQDYFLAFAEKLPGPEIAARWIAATEHVLALGGTPVHLVHPDNVLRSQPLLDAYARFLGWARDKDLDVCLPGDVADRLGPRPAS